MRTDTFLKILTVCAALLPAQPSTATPANADSCWTHNGSLMRLKADGNRRWFLYEAPRPVCVTPG
ncbi:MAG: hypothetical protein HPM95_13425 [Alphaproteobacteria bacterium]|nr:hypothetical protein [Alphaproteobacteria bacterium]